MAFNRDWDNTDPIDHSKVKSFPGFIRSLMIDIEDRLNALFYGFISGETFIGMKKGKFITVGTGTPTAPLGTGPAADIDVYAKTIAGKVELFIQNVDGQEIQLTSKGKLLGDKLILSNLAPIQAWNVAGTSLLDLIYLNGADKVTLPVAAVLAASTAPASDTSIVCKKYVDDQIDDIAAASDDVTATPVANKIPKLDASGEITPFLNSKVTVMNTVAFTGNGAAKAVAHGLGITPKFVRIISTDGTSASEGCWATGMGSYMSEGAAKNSIVGVVDATNFNFTGTAGQSNVNGVAYVAVFFG